MSAIERLLERLQSGWAPQYGEIDREIRQHDMLDWHWYEVFGEPAIILAGSDPILAPRESGRVLWIDEHLEWALCEDGFYWLYDNQESDKVRYLGG